MFQTTARTNTVWAFSILELCTSGNREAGIAVFSLGLEIPEPAKLNQLGPVHAFLRMKFFSSSNINTRTSTQERVETGGNGGKRWETVGKTRWLGPLESRSAPSQSGTRVFCSCGTSWLKILAQFGSKGPLPPFLAGSLKKAVMDD